MATGVRDDRLIYIGMQLRTLRESMNYSQEDMADRIAISPATVCRYESAIRVPPFDVLLDYARVFGVPVSRLLPEEYVQRDLPQEYYELSIENQKVVQDTMCALINSLLRKQNQI